MGENDAKLMAELMWSATELLDSLSLYTTEVFQKRREDLISRQQQEMLELSTPVVELWKGILAVPLIGTLDSNRTQVVMQNLLEAIVSREASLAIIDITGVPTVDTLVAQHLLKTVAAARLMGAECLISGIRPQIGNSIKYRSPDGPLHIDITVEKDSKGGWIVQVRDNGAGIERQHLERIFEPFRRLHGYEIAGTGLGLALCRRIIEAHGGRIWAESFPGEGATLLFTLRPADADTAAA
ncbi:MAG: sensor histidine kinase [Bryobacteraceae bacterium]